MDDRHVAMGVGAGAISAEPVQNILQWLQAGGPPPIAAEAVIIIAVGSVVWAIVRTWLIQKDPALATVLSVQTDAPAVAAAAADDPDAAPLPVTTVVTKVDTPQPPPADAPAPAKPKGKTP